ncbi:MAG TPA: hypothetical protein PKK26_09040 [Candidatus Wallbacteria bacterium]|nr:hypothetical protein [Candidatus Wallbacteria bacterium]
MAEILNITSQTQFNFSISASLQFSANVNVQKAIPVPDGTRDSGNKTEQTNSSNSGINLDEAFISIHAKALNFINTVFSNAKVSSQAAQTAMKRFSDDPKLDIELQKLYILLEPFYEDPELKDSFDKLFYSLAENMGRLSNDQVSGVAQNLNGILSKAASAQQSAAQSANQSVNQSMSQSMVQVETSISAQVSVQITNQDGKPQEHQFQQIDPLIIDVDKNGFDLTTAEDGVSFDIDGDGKEEKTAVTSGEDGMLALDKDENGVIDNGKELFGDQNGAKDGFEELSKYDDNKDNVIDENDKAFSKLQILRYKMNQEKQMVQQLVSLKSAGIVSIDISKISAVNESVNGNLITHKTGAYNGSGGVTNIGEAYFQNYKI